MAPDAAAVGQLGVAQPAGSASPRRLGPRTQRRVRALPRLGATSLRRGWRRIRSAYPSRWRTTSWRSPRRSGGSAGARHPGFTVITIGAGVGYGLVVHGEVVRSREAGLGLGGHVPLSANGPVCHLRPPWLRRGDADLRVDRRHRSRHPFGDRSTTTNARADDKPAARTVVDAAADALGRLVALAANLTLQPSTVLPARASACSRSRRSRSSRRSPPTATHCGSDRTARRRLGIHGVGARRAAVAIQAAVDAPARLNGRTRRRSRGALRGLRASDRRLPARLRIHPYVRCEHARGPGQLHRTGPEGRDGLALEQAEWVIGNYPQRSLPGAHRKCVPGRRWSCESLAMRSRPLVVRPVGVFPRTWLGLPFELGASPLEGRSGSSPSAWLGLSEASVMRDYRLDFDIAAPGTGRAAAAPR